MTPQTYHCILPCGCTGEITHFCTEAERLMGAVQAARDKLQQFKTLMWRGPVPFEYHDAYDQAVRELMEHFGWEGDK